MNYYLDDLIRRMQLWERLKLDDVVLRLRTFFSYHSSVFTTIALSPLI
jgi:hypothetical protein